MLALCVNVCGSGLAAPATSEVAAYEPIDFAPMTLDPKEGDTFDLLVSADLERTPRDYVKVTATVKTDGIARVALVLVDILDREYRSPPVQPTPAQETEISIDMQQVGRPMSMLRMVRLYAEGKPVEVLGLRIYCAVEKLPEPDVTVEGPLDDTSIQAALDALGEDGGVVYIPAGEYVINNQVIIPADNITIYGDGRDTILQGVWFEARALILAEDKENLRVTRLHLRGLPIDEFRGYNDNKYAAKPEDVGRPSVISRGIRFVNCRNVRVDHCEVELFGHGGVLFYGGTDNLVDHCFLHENFRYGLGYGVVTPGTKELHIEGNNFENHRHGLAGNARGASYIARFNRLVKDTATVPAEGWAQVRSHEIDAHAGCGWIYAHDNYVAMRNGTMSSGAAMRGNPGWLYRNVFVNCGRGIYCLGASDDVWTWDNEFSDCAANQHSTATGAIHLDEKPPNFAEIPYPYALNRMGWWPGAKEGAAEIVKAETQFAGPADAQVLRLGETAP